MDVGDMHLNHRRVQGEERVKDRNGRRRKAAWIDDKTRCPLRARLLNGVDDYAFMVRLAKFNPDAVSLRRRAAQLLDVGQCGATVDFRLALAEQIEIGSVKY